MAWNRETQFAIHDATDRNAENSIAIHHTNWVSESFLCVAHRIADQIERKNFKINECSWQTNKGFIFVCVCVLLSEPTSMNSDVDVFVGLHGDIKKILAIFYLVVEIQYFRV